MDDAYQRLIRRMNPPRVVIDNNSCETATVIQVDSVNKRGILLDVVQILADLNLIITKAYISSDGGWFMDVFNVTDQDGRKLRDEKIVDYIQKSLDTESSYLTQTVGVMASKDHTSIELVGADRPGLLSEVCAVLTCLKCNVVEAEVWTHNARAAAVVLVTDASTGAAIEDQKRLSLIKELLCNVLKGNNNDLRAPKTRVALGATHRQRRLHQMMYEDRDYERNKSSGAGEPEESISTSTLLRPQVTLSDCLEKDYSVVTMRSQDRPKLLFDTICTLTDMQYVVFHGTVATNSMEAYQEYYIRHVDGFPISSEAERQRVIRCLEAAVERRTSEGLKLELNSDDRVGLLSDVTRIFRENSLLITRAEITTKDGKALDTFYVRDVSGNPVDTKTIESICHQLGQTVLKVKHSATVPPSAPAQVTITGYLFGSLFKSRSLQNLRLIRSCS